MRLLILGGTVFLGRYLVESALARGHEVTLFNRGQHNPELFPEVEKLRGDRGRGGGDLAALHGRRWDAAIDTCGYVPRIVRLSAEALAGAVGHYTFISSISVYREDSPRGIDESGAVGTLSDDATDTEDVTGETYGPLKALCERAAEEAMPGRVLAIRPGLIVGPHDPSDRFTYWPHRVALGGEVLAPGRPQHPVQIVDVRDLAAWTIAMAEQARTGIYNASGPDRVLTMGDVLDTCRACTNAGADIVWIDEQFLLDHDVQPWSEMPLWIPEQEDALSSVNCRKAIAAGLSFRPLAATVADTAAWDTTRPPGHEWRAGMTAERERALLQAWHARTVSQQR